jgi:hypothetical protein
MDPELIKAVKKAAIEDEISASEILEEAARGWLEQRKLKLRIAAMDDEPQRLA